MHWLKNRSLHFYLAFILILALALGGTAIAALASTPSNTSTTVAVTAGNLSESAPGTAVATAVTLNGTDQTTTYTLPVTVNDARGSGAGWNLTITSTTFKDTSNDTLSTQASSLTVNSAVCVAGSSCNFGTNGITSPVPVPAASSAPTAAEFFNTGSPAGQGTILVTSTVTVSIPANTLAGTYSSTVTVAVSTGP